MKYAKNAENLKPSELRELTKLGGMPEVYNFASGLPARELFPLKEMLKVDEKIYSTDGERAVQYGASEGYTPLREQIAARMKDKFDVDCRAEDVLITTGSQQGLSMLSTLFLEEGDVVFVESPTYLGALNAMELSAPKFVAVPTDEQGMLPDELDKMMQEYDNVRMVYVIPDFQNPSGITWSLERRKAFMEVMKKYDVPVLEDAPYAELRYDGDRLPTLKSLDTTGRVVFLGSFSKIMMPGLRVGWLVASPEVMHKLVMIKQRVDLQSGTFAQYQVSYFMDMYDLDAHVAKIKDLYRKRRDVLCDAIEEYFPEGTKVERPEGGLFVWVTMPENVDMQSLVPKMLEKKITYVHGSPFYPEGGHNNHCRMNFSSMEEHRIVEGIKLMAQVLKENM